MQNRGDGELGLEIISYIGHTLFNSAATTFLSYSNLWKCLESEVEIVDSGPGYESCGTHVHVSVFDRKRHSREHFKLLAKAVVYFERCVDSLMPPCRRHNKFCRSNRYNSKLKSLSMPQIIQAIEDVGWRSETPEFQLVDLLCPVLENGSHRYYRWNFFNLTNPNPHRWTVEFRQPPGSTTAYQAKLWPQFALAFIRGAALYNIKGISLGNRSLGPSIDSSHPATMDELSMMLVKGGTGVNGVDTGILRDLVEGKEMLDEGSCDEESFGPEDDQYIEAKERAGKVIADKFQAHAETFLEELPFADGPGGF